jgi:septal ring factor EnvC (AmiA/AmiB activator)
VSLPGTDGLLKEMSPGWRHACSAAIFSIALTISYFSFVDGPIASAQESGDRANKRIDKVDQDIAAIKENLSDIKASSAVRDQKIDDLKESMAAINAKLDRLLTRDRRAAVYP